MDHLPMNECRRARAMNLVLLEAMGAKKSDSNILKISTSTSGLKFKHLPSERRMIIKYTSVTYPIQTRTKYIEIDFGHADCFAHEHQAPYNLMLSNIGISVTSIYGRSLTISHTSLQYDLRYDVSEEMSREIIIFLMGIIKKYNIKEDR
jgi:hypothetical protein